MKQNLPFLYRAYKHSRHAKQFIEAGKVRLRIMIDYRIIEDAHRRDEGEGVSSWYVENGGHIIGQHINPLYLFCTAGPNADLAYLRSKYGKSIVRINDPLRLLVDLNNHRPRPYRIKVVSKCKIEPVSYTKDEVLNTDPNTFEAIRLSYAQKGTENLIDQEYRYIVQTEPDGETTPDRFLYYDFGGPIGYVEMV
jgi:hypothetical protein